MIGPVTPERDRSRRAPAITFASGQGKAPSTRPVLVLDRRAMPIFASVRGTGAAVRLITRRRVGVIYCADRTIPVDMYIGTGGAPGACWRRRALRCIAGRCNAGSFSTPTRNERARKMGVSDPR
jgi:fructose-1,6-bisphosphatase/sedoheptulose 1,7-bisphosphatase-like protein